MPLSKIQIDILHTLAANRDPESFVGGSTPLNLRASRFSRDIDVFHDREERVASAALADAATLQAQDFKIQWTRREPAIHSLEVERDSERTRLEWVADSDFRFFPIIRDELFGYVLHPVDLAANKVMAAAGRRELRDIVATVTVHQTILPLGALIWAAFQKSPGFTPEGLIAEIRRNSNYSAAEWRELASAEPLDSKRILSQLRSALDEAEAFVLQMPTDKVGLLFLKDGHVVQPDPNHLDQYQTHAAERRGQWPSNSEISTAMLQSYKLPDSTI